MEPSKIIIQFMETLLNQMPESEQDLLNIILRYAQDKNMKTKQLCELIRMEYWISWPYAQQLHNLQHEKCKVCNIEKDRTVQYESLTLTTSSSLSIKLDQCVTREIKQAPKYNQTPINCMEQNAIPKYDERNVSNSTICITDSYIEDVSSLTNTLATNDINTLKHLTQANIDYDQLSKCYMKLHFDNVRIEMPIRDHIQQLFTEHGYHPNVPSETTSTALNFQKCAKTLLLEIISIINNSQWANVWLIHALHQLTLIAPYHYKNDTVWSQYIYIVRQWINDALNNCNYTESPITKKLAKYTAHLLNPNESDKEEILADLEETYNDHINQYSLQRILTCLEVIRNVNCRDPVDQLALLRAIQISGECVKNTANGKQMTAQRRVTLAPLTDETQQELTNCRNDLSHCVSLPYIDISLLETIKHKLRNLHQHLQTKQDSLPEKPITERVQLNYHLNELGKHLRRAPTELETRMEPITFLQSILQDVSLQEFRKDHKLSAAVTTLVLCIFEALKNKNKLKENKYWILDRFPILLDRQLRNYLAHSGWFQLLPIDETAALYYSAQMLIKPEFCDQIQKEISPPSEDDWYAAYYAKKKRLTKVENFWQEIRTNQVAKVTLSIKEDATLLHSRCLTDHKHALHFAAEAGEAMIRLILDIEERIGKPQLAQLTDRNGYTVLHIAALTSNHHTIKVLRLSCKNVEPRQQCLRECKTALHLAVESKKTAVVRELLKFINNGVHLKDSNGYQALHQAVRLKDLEIVRMLADSPIDELKTGKGKTCLYLAAQHGHISIAEYLLELGSDVHQFYKGLTPLHIAALNNHLPVVELLLKHGAHLNLPLCKLFYRAEDNKLKIILHIEEWINQYKLTYVSNYNELVKFWEALQKGSAAAVVKFIKNCTINFRTCSREDGNCALHYSVEGGNMDCIRLVIDKCNINARNFKNQTALHTAALFGNLKAVKLLLQKNVALDIYDIDGFLAIHQAVKNNKFKIMNLMIAAHKAKSNYLRSKYKQTCLQIACEYGHVNIVVELLKNDTTECINTFQISKLLLVAAKSGHLNVAIVLFSYGADGNILGKDGESALHFAASQGNLEMCRLLVNHGAYSETTNKAKLTPRDIAIVNCHDSIVSYLDSVKQEEAQKIFQKIQQHDLKYIKNYFKLKPKLLELMRFENSKTLLHCAVESKSIKMVSFVFRHAPALQNVLDGKRQTILHSAATNQCGNECPRNCTKIILGFILRNCKSVKIDLLNFTGKSALQLAVRLRNKHAVAELLNQYVITPSADVFLAALAEFDSSIMASLVMRLENLNKRLMPDGRTFLHLAAKFVCPHSRSSDMKACCQCSQFKAFQYLLNSKNVDVNARTDYKLTPLHIAARNGNVGIVENLIAKGADVNALGDYQTAALTLAARHNHTEVTGILVKERANVNGSNWQNRTALFYALCNKNLNIVRMLIENGGNMKKEYEDVKTSEEIKQYLIENVQEMSAKLIAFWDAIRSEKFDLVSSFLQNHLFPCASASNDTFQNALHIAAGSSSLEMNVLLFSHRQLQNAYHNKDRNGRTVLHIAIYAGKTEIVEYILNNCPLVNVNEQDYVGFNAMHIAAAMNHVHILKMLFARHANCNQSDQFGNTPLHFAATNGYTEVARLLLEHGAALDVFGEDKYAPLHLAVIGGHTDIVDLLLHYGTDVDILGPDNQTPLHVAAIYGQELSARMLILHGAQVDSCDIDHDTPLHLAALSGQYGLIMILNENSCNLNARNLYGNTPMHAAATKGQDNVAVLLSAVDAKLNARNDMERTPLHVAALRGHLKFVNALLDIGTNINFSRILDENCRINVNVTDKFNLTPIHMASMNGHSEVVKMLITHEAKIDVCDTDNNTPLYLAAEEGHLNVVNTLLEYFARTDMCNIKNNTPLHAAALNGHTEVVSALIHDGADICARNIKGNTPLHAAVLNGHIDVVQLLIKLGTDVDVRGMDQETPLHFAATHGHINIYNHLILHGASVNARNSSSCTPLHFAAYYGHELVVVRLIQHGAGIEDRDADENTPLHIAALRGHTNVVTILLQHSTSIEVKNIFNNTPLHSAAKNGHTSVAKVLIQNGASIDARGKQNFTPLHLAAMHGHSDMVKLLIKHGAKIDALTTNNNTPYELAAMNERTDVINQIIQHGADLNINFNNNNSFN